MVLLWLLLPEAAVAQHHRPAADSLRQALRYAQPDTNRVHLLLRLGQLYAAQPFNFSINADSAYAYAKKAEALSRILHFTSGYDQSQLLVIQAGFNPTHLSQLAAALQNQRLYNTGKALLTIAEYYLYKPGELPTDLDAAEQYVRRVLKYQPDKQNIALKAEATVVLGRIYGERGNHAQALRYYRQAPSLINQVPDLLLQAKLWYWVGNGYRRTPDEMPARIACYERARALYHRAGSCELEALTLKQIADMQQHQGHFAPALQNLLEVIQMQRATHSAALHYTYDLLGAIYAALGSYEQALPYALATVEHARAARDTAELPLFFYRIGRR